MKAGSRLFLVWAVLMALVIIFPQGVEARIEAVRGKRYTLSKQHGPWMIMVASFRNITESERTEGLTAMEAADELVFELRKKGIPAYIFQQQGALGRVKTLDRMGREDQRIYAAQRGMVSVLAGNYPNIDPEDKQGNIAQKTLTYIKKMNPEIMNKGAKYRPTPGRPGPLSGAFFSVNPLLSPDELLARKKDPLITQLNSGMEHSLLQNPGKYTLVIKSFSGKSVTKLADNTFNDVVARFDSKLSNSLDDAAMSAWQLTEALRNGRSLGYPADYEAYVFHDRYNSVVTIGSFDSPDDPRIKKFAQMFGGKIKKNPENGKDFLAAEVLTIPRNPKPNQLPEKSWVFDPKPRLMKVPSRGR